MKVRALFAALKVFVNWFGLSIIERVKKMYIKIDNIDGTAREGEISPETFFKLMEVIFGAIPTDETVAHRNEEDKKI